MIRSGSDAVASENLPVFLEAGREIAKGQIVAVMHDVPPGLKAHRTLQEKQ